MDPHRYSQWARPSLHVFILRELNTAECEGLACEINCYYVVSAAVQSSDYKDTLKLWRRMNAININE